MLAIKQKVINVKTRHSPLFFDVQGPKKGFYTKINIIMSLMTIGIVVRCPIRDCSNYFLFFHKMLRFASCSTQNVENNKGK